MSKLGHFIRLLSKKEIQRFKDFLESPYHNKDATMLPLFEEVLRGLGKEKAAGKDSSDVRKSKSRLLQLLMEFLGLQGFQAAGILPEILQLREMNARGEEKYFPKVYARAKKAVSAAVQDSELHYGQLYALEVELNKHLSQQTKRSIDFNLENVEQNLEQEILLRRLKYACLKANLNRLQGKEGDDAKIASLLDEVEGNIEEADLLIRLFHYHLMTLVRPDEERFFTCLLKQLEQSFGSICHADAVDLYSGSINYCIRRINAGQEHVQLDLMKLYKQAMSQRVFIENGRLSPFHLKNMVSLSARLGEYKWALGLVDDFASKIPGAEGKHSESYNRGIIAYYQGDFSSARNLLNAVLANFQDLFYGLDARIFLLRIYYECQEMDLAESACHAFRIFLYRQKGMGEPRKKNYATFIRLYRRICTTDPVEVRKWEKLRDEIEDMQKLPVKNWLLEQIQQRIPTPSYLN